MVPMALTSSTGRTLCVAKSPHGQSWPPTSVFFPTISDALAQAATMTPVEGNPVAVIIFPGTYPENIEIPSWVFLSSSSTELAAVTIEGDVRWTPTGNTFEVVQLYFLNIRRSGLVGGRITVTTIGKTGGQTTFILHGCSVNGLEVNGRSASGTTRDFVFAARTVPGTDAFTLHSCLFEWVAGRLKGMTFNGACVFRIIGSTTIPTAVVNWFVNDTS